MGAGCGADNLSNPLWDELGHAPPGARAPPPREVRLLPLPAGDGGGAGGWDTCLLGPTVARRSLTAGPTAAAQLKMCCLPSGPSKLRTPTAPALLMPLDRGAVGASPQARVCGSGTAAHYLARKDPRAAEGSRARRPTAVWAPRRTAGSWAAAKRGRLPVRRRRGPPS